MKKRRDPPTGASLDGSQRRSGGVRGERTATAKSVPEYVRQEFSQGASIHPLDGLHINRV